MNAVDEIMRRHRQGDGFRRIARALALPERIVELAIRYYASRATPRRSDWALEIPQTSPGLWRCRECGELLEFAPCVRCGPAGQPRQVKRPPPARSAGVGGVREVNSVCVL
jgi:hypothetical protein